MNFIKISNRKRDKAFYYYNLGRKKGQSSDWQLPKELKVSEGIIRDTKMYVDSHILRMEGDNTLLQGVSYRALVALKKVLDGKN